MVARVNYNRNVTHFADVAELADALDSGSSGGNFVEVQVLSSAPNVPRPHNSENQQSAHRGHMPHPQSAVTPVESLSVRLPIAFERPQRIEYSIGDIHQPHAQRKHQRLAGLDMYRKIARQ